MAQEHVLLLRDCVIIDATSPSPREGSVVVVGEHIQEVTDSRRPSIPSGAEVIDLGGAFLLPGLWDVHVHMGRGVPDSEARDESVAERTIRAGRNCMDALALGITGIRVVGERDFIDVAWKRAFDSGRAVGPTLFTCGYFHTTTAGHFLRSGCALEVDGPEGFCRAVREQIKNGVDFIKLNMTGGVMGPPWDRMPNTFLLPDEIEAVFELCRRRGFKVVAHAGGTDGIKAAVRAGAHTIEHGYMLDDEAIGLMVEKGTYYVPTLSLTHLNRGPEYAVSEYERDWARKHPVAEEYRQRAIQAATAHAEGFKKALQAGVKIACGSDLDPPSGGLLELGMLVRCGMTPWQAIVAATQTAAEVCCAQDSYGTIEPGKKADILILDANPLDAIENVRRLRLVIKKGRVVVRR